jgi:hypothetical protein
MVERPTSFIMTEPIDVINNWQIWYRENRTMAAPKHEDLAWVCNPCGTKYGNWYQGEHYSGPLYHVETCHEGSCDICGAIDVFVAGPEGYGGFVPNWRELKKQTS